MTLKTSGSPFVQGVYKLQGWPNSGPRDLFVQTATKSQPKENKLWQRTKFIFNSIFHFKIVHLGLKLITINFSSPCHWNFKILTAALPNHIGAIEVHKRGGYCSWSLIKLVTYVVKRTGYFSTHLAIFYIWLLAINWPFLFSALASKWPSKKWRIEKRHGILLVSWLKITKY